MVKASTSTSEGIDFDVMKKLILGSFQLIFLNQMQTNLSLDMLNPSMDLEVKRNGSLMIMM